MLSVMLCVGPLHYNWLDLDILCGMGLILSGSASTTLHKPNLPVMKFCSWCCLNIILVAEHVWGLYQKGAKKTAPGHLAVVASAVVICCISLPLFGTNVMKHLVWLWPLCMGSSFVRCSCSICRTNCWHPLDSWRSNRTCMLDSVTLV